MKKLICLMFLSLSCVKPSAGTSIERADLDLIRMIQKVDQMCTELCGAPADEFSIEPGHEECFCHDGRVLKVK